MAKEFERPRNCTASRAKESYKFIVKTDKLGTICASSRFDYLAVLQRAESLSGQRDWSNHKRRHQCGACGKLPKPLKEHQFTRIFGGDQFRPVCLGCNNKFRALEKKRDDAKEIAKLTKNLKEKMKNEHHQHHPQDPD
jgi:hypothetical protein